ncbi:MAG TPA: alpha/beta hydrolase [Steroidobacteraceae bacterium]|nr:alpha/beta hydrolase [Steroidobacteraceae bacterium]
MNTFARRVELPHCPELCLHAQQWGSEAPSLLLIHGFGDGRYIWNHVLPDILHYGSVVTVDLRGHGDSDHGPTSAYATSTHAADVAVVLESFFARNVILVGHSLGAQVAIHLATSHVQMVRAVVLVDGGPEMDTSMTAHVRRTFASQRWRYTSIDDYADVLRERLPLAAHSLLQALASHALCRDDSGGYSLKCDWAMGKEQIPDNEELIWNLFRSIRCPCLLVRGEGSAILSRAAAAKMAEANPVCCVQSVPLAGHAVFVDNPDGFLGTLDSFLPRIIDQVKASRDARGYETNDLLGTGDQCREALSPRITRHRSASASQRFD